MNKKAPNRIPVVFISSTSEDLKAYRKRARDAALAAGFYPRMMEYFPAGGNPPLAECLARVSGSRQHAPADLLIAIVAHRYGWVPEDQPKSEHKSITWLECLQAHKKGKDVLVFLLDEQADWPEQQKEEFQLVTALREGNIDSDLVATVQRNVAGLTDFKTWLSQGRVRDRFTDAADLYGKVLAALQDWLNRHPEIEVTSSGDPSRYLRTLYEETAYIDIRGLQVGSGRANRFPIEDLYITLETAPTREPEKGKKADPDLQDRPARLELEQSLTHSRLVVLGDPGAGKTTFLRRICQLACRGLLEDDSEALQTLGVEEVPFPIFVRLSELQEHRTAHKGRLGAPAVASALDWLAHFLGSQWDADGLDAKFFQQRLSEGPALLLLDGLDEAASQRDRKSLVKWIEKASARWDRCRIVVTSRPAAYQGEAVLPGFAHASIEPLQDSAIRSFFSHWCQALFAGNGQQASRLKGELLKALESRLEIRRMARNPVMLTALAVVHWNEKRIPEQRADLYESILAWLSRSREDLPHRPSPETSLGHLQALALAMHDHKKGRQVQMARHWATEALAPRWHRLPEVERLAAAEKFLGQEELDSGIVVGRRSDIRFWHLSFQEYLTARALAGLPDRQQHRKLLGRLYRAEWREVVLLLAGVLHGQGVEKVNGFFSAVLDPVEKDPSLPNQARCAGLLGAVLRDLAPLDYQPSDSRYQSVLDQVMAIFDRERSKEIPIKVAIEAAEALGQTGDPRLEPAQLEENWVEIPAGEFWMGAQDQDESARNHDPEAYEDESPVHRVYLDGFEIGRYPVTVAEFEGFLRADGYPKKEYWDAEGFGQWDEPEDWEEQQQHPNRPVVGVSWYEASAYARWAGVRLPTEAEWERAARGAEGRKWPWGDDEHNPELLNCWESKIKHPTPVGVYPRGATPEGIADLAGNVWEWCLDWFGEYSTKPRKNPNGPKKGDGRVVRGGAWLNEPRNCRSSYRYWDVPTYRSEYWGFRVVRISARTKRRKS